MARAAINPSEELAYSEFKTELYQSEMTGLENLMDQWVGMNDESGFARAQIAQIRSQINLVRAAIGFWRGEASFWRQEINENKLAVKEGNKLATTG
jgi:hypothetical protein